MQVAFWKQWDKYDGREEVFGNLKDAKHHMERKLDGRKVLDRWICLIIEINRI